MYIFTICYLIFMNFILNSRVYGQCDGDKKIIHATDSPGHVSLPPFEKSSNDSVRTCRWQIEVGRPNMSVLFSIIHNNMTCSSDTLHLTSSDVNITTLCSANHTEPYVTRMTIPLAITLTVRSNGPYGKEFMLWYLGIDNTHSGSICASSSSLIPSDEKQFITSPAFPEYYPTKMVCKVDLTSPDIFHDVMVEILYIDMEPHIACRYDFLQVNKYYTYLMFQRRLCYNNSFERKVYKGQKINLMFRSDATNVGRGFLASFSIIEREVQECTFGKSDLVFLIDSSHSVGWENFRIQLGFVMEILSQFNISRDGLHVSLVTFADDVISQFWLDEYVDTDSAVDAIKTIRYVGGSTETAKALEFIHSQSFCTCLGARLKSTKTLIILTDGLSVDPRATKVAARKLHSDNITVIAIGISNYDEFELSSLASDEKYIFRLHTFSALTTIIQTLQDTVCSIAAKTVSDVFNYTTLKNSAIDPSILTSTPSISSIEQTSVSESSNGGTISYNGLKRFSWTAAQTNGNEATQLPQRNSISLLKAETTFYEEGTTSSIPFLTSKSSAVPSSTNWGKELLRESENQLNPQLRKIDDDGSVLSPFIVWFISISSVLTFIVVTSCCCFWILVGRRRRRNRRKRAEYIATWHIGIPMSDLETSSVFGKQIEPSLRHINYKRRSSVQASAE